METLPWVIAEWCTRDVSYSRNFDHEHSVSCTLNSLALHTHSSTTRRRPPLHSMQPSRNSPGSEAKSLAQESDVTSSLRDEQLNAEPTKGDDQYDEEVESGTPDAHRSIWSRFRKILLILVAMWLALMILRGSGSKRPKVIHATRFVPFIPLECMFTFTPDAQVFGKLQIPTRRESRHH